VLRIVGKDTATTANEAQLADDIFGASGDALNLKSGFDRCSYGQLRFEPLTTNPTIGPDGVYTVSLPNTIVTGSDNFVVSDAALAKATQDLGTSPNLLADHVMICIPPGTGTWLAAAPPNHWVSYFNDNWCRYPSAQMHELGKSALPSPIIRVLQSMVHSL
jgi:hypothetical protein